VGEGYKVIGASDKVSFAANLDRTNAVASFFYYYQASFGFLASFLGCCGQTFFAQSVDSFFKIAVISLQRFRAIQEAGAGDFSEFFDHRCGDSHANFILI
jgi:hypothetical protein